MNFPSNILSIFSQHAGTQNPTDGDIDVPSSLMPVVEIPETLNKHSAVGDSSTIQRTSFAISVTTEQTNTAGSGTPVCFIGNGLWCLDINISWQANFTLLTAGTANRLVLVNSLFAFQTDLFVFYYLNNWVNNQNRQFNLAITGPPNQSLNLQINTTAQGAAQTVNVSCSVVGNRLG